MMEVMLKKCTVELRRCDGELVNGNKDKKKSPTKRKSFKNLHKLQAETTTAVSNEEKHQPETSTTVNNEEKLQAETSATVKNEEKLQAETSTTVSNVERLQAETSTTVSNVERLQAETTTAASNEEPPVLERRRPKRECVGRVMVKQEQPSDDEASGEVYDSSASDDGQMKKKKRKIEKRLKTSPATSSKMKKTSASKVSSTTKVMTEEQSSDGAATDAVKRRNSAKIYENSSSNSSQGKPSDGASGQAAQSTGTPQPARAGGQVGRPASMSRITCTELVSSDLTPELMSTIALANNMNTRRDLELQTLYVKIDDATDGMNALLGWAVKAESKLFFQCMFCPVIDTTAKGISTHIRSAHQKLSFAMLKKVPQSTSMLFMHCRRCDYISVDIVSMWIHYSIHHGLHGILSNPDVTDVTPPPTTRRSLNASEVAMVFPFFKCSMCQFLATDNRYVAEHVVQNHSKDDVSGDYNGCFVRVIKLIKPKQPTPGDTYTDVVEKLEGAAAMGIQTDTFVCVLCSYVSYSRYLAISHHMRLHTGKYLLYKCSYDQCRERSSSSESMIQHLKSVHECGTLLYQRMCCQVTMVEKHGHTFIEAFSL